MAERKRCLSLAKVLRGHKGLIFRQKWSPCGKFLATPSQDQTVMVWEFDTGKVVSVFDLHDEEVNSLSWSPDSQYVASVSDDRKLLVWKARDAKLVGSFCEHRDEVNDVDWSADGKRIASVSDDKRVIVRELLPTEDGFDVSSTFELDGHRQSIWSCRWSPDGKWLATGSDDEEVRLWSIKTGERRVYSGHLATVRCVRWLPNSKVLVSAARDGTIKVWDIESPDDPATIDAHSALVSSIEFDPETNLLFSKGNDGFVRAWRLPGGKLVDEFSEDASTRWSCGIAVCPERRLLATLDERNEVVRVWDIENDFDDQCLKHDSQKLPKIFVSYSHKDKDFLDRLVTMLRPLSSDGTINLWTDLDIEVGDRWKSEIMEALDDSTIAILLVSPDFLASPFITRVELPYLLKSADNRGVSIVWIPVRHSLYEKYGLDAFQAAGDPSKPLASLSEDEQESLLAQICRTIDQMKAAQV